MDPQARIGWTLAVGRDHGLPAPLLAALGRYLGGETPLAEPWIAWQAAGPLPSADRWAWQLAEHWARTPHPDAADRRLLALLVRDPAALLGPFLDALAGDGRGLAQLLEDDDGGCMDLALAALTHCTRTQRDAAVAFLRTRGDAAVARVAPLLEDPSAEVRGIAVDVLGGIESAREILRAHVTRERSGRVRKAILDAVGASAALTEQAEQAGQEALAALAEATLRTLGRKPVRWFDHAAAPALRWADGTPAPVAVGGYLAWCQSACRGLDLDPRVAPVMAHLHRDAAAVWALALLAAWLDAGADARDQWAMALAAVVGGDRVVAALHAQVEAWHRGSRRPMALQGANLLALLGTDAALRSLDALADSHPWTALGVAAAAALEAEGRALGLARDELLDQLAPTFGLDADRVGELDYGRRRFRVVVGPRLDLELTDTGGRSLTAPPKPGRTDHLEKASAALAAWRALKTELPAAVAREAERLQRAMVAGRTWPAERFRVVIAGHPLLGLLASRLVWGAEAVGLFRPRRGRDLVDADGRVVTLPAAARVRLVHPLELTAETRATWVRALDEGTVQPFEQLRRAVFGLTAGERDAVAWEGLRGAEVRALPDRRRGIAQPWTRAGWEPLPTESGVCRGFVRRYGSGGLEAVLEVAGIAVWSESARAAAVGALRFATPAVTGHAPRTLALGELPAVVFSEAVRDARAMVEAAGLSAGGGGPSVPPEESAGPRHG